MLNAGKVRSWAFDMLSSGDEAGGQDTGISVLDCVFKGSSKRIINVDAIFLLICFRAEEENSDVGVGARCDDIESVCRSSDFMRILLCSIVVW